MLMLLSIFSFLRCTSKSGGSSLTESDTDRAAAFQQFPDALFPVKVKDKWGYMNRKTEMVLVPKWEEADDFFEGFAKVAVVKGQNYAYGFIDAKGEWIVQPAYDKAGHFSEGLAQVKKEGKYGYVDHHGNEIISCQFEEAGPFHAGYAAIKQGGWTGFIDKTGKVSVKPQFTVAVSHPRFKEGLAPVFGADEKTGFIDTSGQWVIDPVFSSAGNFDEGMAWAMIRKDDDQAEYGFTIQGGFIDKKGEYLIDPVYDFCWDFSEGYATCWYRSEDKMKKIWKVIDRNGEVLLSNLPYRNVGSFRNGLLPIQDEDMKWGFMNTKGEVVIPPRFAGINHFKNGLARMEVGTAFSNTMVYINPKGEVAWSEK
jgi:WG containing repeat